MLEAEHVLRVRNELGEGPIWHTSEQALYWIDIERSLYHRFHPATASHETVPVGQKVGTLAFRKSGGFVLAGEHGFALWHPEEKRLEPFGKQADGANPVGFNDGAVDAQGRFWAGTLVGEANNSLYRLDPDGSVHLMDTGFGIPNGIGWSLDDQTMYFTDSSTSTIYAYTFDPETGRIGKRRVLVDSSNRPGVPDGLTVDAEGYIWSARWGAGCVERYDPKGNLVQTVRVPATFPTSVAFGGENLHDLYITSALYEIPVEERHRYPFDGDLFRFRGEVRGRIKPAFTG
jgi:sugar lactone lactonase YvrE